MPEVFALSTVQTLALVVSASWSSPARDQRAKSIGREKTETAKIGGHFCTMACEHKSHPANKKWITVKRFWPCYLLCSTDNLSEIIYLVIYMASIRAMSEHSQTRWVFPHCAPEKEHMLLTLHHRQGIEIPKRQNAFSRETSIWSDKILYNTRGLLQVKVLHSGTGHQALAIGRLLTTLVILFWTMASIQYESGKVKGKKGKGG